MMQVFVESGNIISALGFNTKQNFYNVYSGVSGINEINNIYISNIPLQASIIDNELINNEFAKFKTDKKYTKFEKICILSIYDALQNSHINLKSNKTLFILSTTKGNIELLADIGDFSYNRLHLWETANIITDFFGIITTPLIVSNACISGISAILLAQRLINTGQYDNAVVVGAEVLSKFIVSGFQSFLSLSNKPCKPFDKDRDGLNLGEAAATIILTNNKNFSSGVEFISGATANDANHISGPSRTGDGLFNSITNTLKNYNRNIGFISAHGTATPYNDNMEAVAISRTNLKNTPVNGLKGFFGHTIGAAGILEIIISIEALKNNIILNTIGFDNLGVSEDIYVVNENINTNVDSFLKLGSGFGGCNASALFKKFE